MAAPLVGRKDISTGAVSAQARNFSRVTGKLREARVFFTFPSANVPVSMPHSLGHRPVTWKVVQLSAASGAPGVVYSPITGGGGVGSYTDPAYNLSTNYIVLACSVAQCWAEVVIS